MSEKWSKEFDSCFQVGSIEEIADALEKRSGSEENALAMLAMTAFTLMTRRGICEMQSSLWHHSPSIAFRRLSGYYNVVEALQ
ncbi:TPA: hypothetical protein ACYSRI_004368 [Escherichia coli]